jgi:hypothetical protein
MHMNAKIKDGGKTALLGGIGGLVGGGAKMLVEPSLFKDQTAMKKWWFAVPLGELILGAIGGAIPKTALVGAGLAGAGVAHALENANMAIAIKRNQAAAPASNTSGYGDDDAGNLVSPHRALEAGTLFGGPSMNVGQLVDDETGALVFPSAR